MEKIQYKDIDIYRKATAILHDSYGEESECYQDKDQTLIPIDTVLEIEHIFSRKRQDNEKTLKNKNSLESL